MPFHTAFYTALSGLLLVSLSLRTTWLRGRYQIFEGFGDRIDLQRASRSHGVSVEHLLSMLLMLLMLELCGASHAEVDAFGATMIASRVVHVGGNLVYGRGRFRRTGMAVTYLCEVGLGIALLVQLYRVAG